MMNCKVRDLRGMSFGTLTVIEQGPRSKHNQVQWLCQCTCGKKYNVLGHSLTTGNTKKCDDHPKNDWVVEGDVVLIDVSTPSHNDKWAKIDLDDFEKVLLRVKKTKWLLHDSAPGEVWGKYVVDSNRKTRLHRLVCGVTGSNVVDHINGDTLDNRKVNLRVVTRAENNINMRRRKDNTSGHTGVIKKEGRWFASIQKEGVSLSLGSYDTFQEARAARKGAEKALGFSERHGMEATNAFS